MASPGKRQALPMIAIGSLFEQPIVCEVLVLVELDPGMSGKLRIATLGMCLDVAQFALGREAEKPEVEILRWVYLET